MNTQMKNNGKPTRKRRRPRLGNRLLAVGLVVKIIQLAESLGERLARPQDSVLTMWPPLYWFFVALFRISFVIWGRWKITGRQNLPASGGYIVAANHVSHIDPPVVGSSMDRVSYFMAKAELFRIPAFGKVIPWVGAYPVKRGAPDRAAMKRTLDLLAHGEVVTIFPEGTRGTPGQVGEAESGFGWLVHKARVPVVPIGVIGTADLLPRGARFLKPSRVKVIIGEPLTFEDLWDSPDSRAAIKEIGTRTMATIRDLVAKNADE